MTIYCTKSVSSNSSSMTFKNNFWLKYDHHLLLQHNLIFVSILISHLWMHKLKTWISGPQYWTKLELFKVPQGSGFVWCIDTVIRFVVYSSHKISFYLRHLLNCMQCVASLVHHLMMFIVWCMKSCAFVCVWTNACISIRFLVVGQNFVKLFHACFSALFFYLVASLA